MHHHEGGRSGGFLSPRDFLLATEKWAIRNRKTLRVLETQGTAREFLGLMGDAVSRLIAIEKMASYGKEATAADAVQIAECVELCVDSLGPILDVLLATLMSARR